MARSSGVHVEGLRETVRSLERLGVDVQDLKDAFGQISAEVATEAAGLVATSSGRLRGTIRPAKTKNKAVVRAGTPTGVPYAGVINYGWADRGIAASEFLTRPANADPAAKVARVEANLAALIRKYDLT